MALITVEVVYANETTQQVLNVSLKAQSSIEKAIDYSGILMMFPEIDLTQQKVGIFGQIKKLSDPISPGDRIEIYRPLLVDPKEARKKRAK